MRIKCESCRQEHDLSDISWGFKEPLNWCHLNDAERSKSDLTPDQCIIRISQEVQYYIRGILLLPIRNSKEELSFDVWSSLSEKSFDEIQRTWSDRNRASFGPYPGWFSNRLPFVEDSLNLQCRVVQRDPGDAPLIELRPCDHELARMHHEGLNPKQVQYIFDVLLHQH